MWFSQHDGPLPPACLPTAEDPRLVWTLFKGNLTKMEWGGLGGGLSLHPVSICQSQTQKNPPQERLNRDPHWKLSAPAPQATDKPSSPRTPASPVDFRSRQPFQFPPCSIDNVALICPLDLPVVSPGHVAVLAFRNGPVSLVKRAALAWPLGRRARAAVCRVCVERVLLALRHGCWDGTVTRSLELNLDTRPV